MSEKQVSDSVVTTILFVIMGSVAILALTGLFTIVMAVIHWLHR